MNDTLLAEFARMHAAQLDKFGESVTFWPSDPQEQTVTAVLYRSARLEPRSHGDVESLFVVLSQLDQAPADGDFIKVGDQRYVIPNGGITDPGDGSLTILLRKKN